MNPGDKCDFSKARVGDVVESFRYGLGIVQENCQFGISVKFDGLPTAMQYTHSGYFLQCGDYPDLYWPGSIATLQIQPQPERKVKKVGWVNIYPNNIGWVVIYKDKRAADVESVKGRKACVKVEWEEQEN